MNELQGIGYRRGGNLPQLRRQSNYFGQADNPYFTIERQQAFNAQEAKIASRNGKRDKVLLLCSGA